MSELVLRDYSALDHPEILGLLFHPRPEWQEPSRQEEGLFEMSIPVDKGISIGARMHFADKSAPVILYFHGNGEIVADYDALGPVYAKMGVNFLPVDYRGYGLSNGFPSVSTMILDSHVIFTWTKNWMERNGFSGPFIVMGRSLGSASALELAAQYENQIDALIIESGFAEIIPLLKLVGVDVERLGISQKDDLQHVEKISGFKKPLLIIHAENDQIIPFDEGRTLFRASGSSVKKLLKIQKADHNSIFSIGMDAYLKEIMAIVNKVMSKTPS